MPLSITATQHNYALHYAECAVLFIVKLSVILLNVIMLGVAAPFLEPKQTTFYNLTKKSKG